MISFYLFLTDLGQKVIEQSLYNDFKYYNPFYKFLKCSDHIT